MMSLFGTFVALFIQLDINPIILFFFLTAYFLLFDLFVDVTSKNITWIIWWAIFYSVYMSALLFNFDIRSQIQSRQSFLENVINDYPKEGIISSKSEMRAELAVAELNKLLILPEEATYDQEDILAYLVNKLDVDPNLVEVENTNQFTVIGQNKFRRQRSLLVNINDSIFHNPIQNIVWYRKRINSDFRLNLGFSFETSTSKHFPFNYYRSGKILYEGLPLSNDEYNLISNSDDMKIARRSTNYILYRPAAQELLVAKISFGGLIKPIALFSFYFCFIIIIAAAFSIVHRLYQFLPEDWPFNIRGIESLNSKIQISLILVILLSFVIIASITHSFLNSYLTEEKDAFYKNKINSVANALSINSSQAANANELLAIYSNYEEEVENIHDVDLTIRNIIDPRIDYFTYSYFNRHAPFKPYTG